MKSHENRVAIVTGSTGNVGAGIAMRIAALGGKVVVNGRNDEAGANVVRRVRESGGEAVYVRGDVTREDDMNVLVEAALDTFGRLDTLVASAGGIAQSVTSAPNVQGLFHTLSMPAVADIVARATAAKLLPAHAATRHFVQKQSGSILFVTSEGGRAPTAGQTALACYAGGLIMTTKVLAKELARNNIRANCIAMTLIADTSWNDVSVQMSMTPIEQRRYARVAERAPLGLATPDEIGALAAFLTSDDARHITGATISPTGGLTFS